MKSKVITISRIFDEDWFTDWELEDIVLGTADQWFLIFEYIGNFQDELVYACHDSEIKQKLLLAPKRRALWKKFESAYENNKMHGYNSQK